MISPVRNRLRAETFELHARLEYALDLTARLDRRSEVLFVLARLHGLFAGVEPELDRALGSHAMEGRHRLADLRHDLGAMGLTSDQIDRLAVLTWPPPPTADEAIGALYVLEGMRLGGRVIGRALAAQEWAPQGGLRFWADAPSASEAWGTFAQRLEGVTTPGAAVQGAAEMFETCLAWLVPQGAAACLHGGRTGDTQPLLWSMGA